MKMLDVYPVYDICPVRGEGCYVWDSQGKRYLDFYGGHAVISIGHSHPRYVKRVSEQLGQLGFYSNSVKIPVQEELASKLAEQSGYPDYELFLCNSGAEANENAIKLAAFNHSGKKIIVFEGAFHGRTSMAVAATDNPRIQTQFDNENAIVRLPLNDLQAFKENMDASVCAVIVEGIQGIAGIYEPEEGFLREVRRFCDQFGSLLILDEIQSGFGRTGRFFAHQHTDVKADLITMAKGMGNGFPVGGVLANPKLKTWKGMLGSTFGGNHLACAATLSVLEVLDEESLVERAESVGKYLQESLQAIQGVREIRGRGLMVGAEFHSPVAESRKELLFDHQIFTGASGNPNVLRLLPPLTVTQSQVDDFIQSLKKIVNKKPNPVL